jgi:hypothetical protein
LVARRLAFPYTVGLVITGVVLTHDFIFDVILPPLLFETAFNLHRKELCRDALPILTRAFYRVVANRGDQPGRFLASSRASDTVGHSAELHQTARGTVLDHHDLWIDLTCRG